MRLAALPLICLLTGSFAPARAAEPTVDGVRVTPLRLPTAGRAGFTLLGPDATGVNFTNTLDEWASASNRVLNNGSGVAAGDFDNDGWVDLFFCSLDQRNRLFKNLGQWRFEDVTAQAGLRFGPSFFRAAVFADLNGDGWLDLLVGSVGQGVLCFLNDQRGHFTDVTAEAGTASPFANETLALADIDGNGTLDLYACNNRNDDIRDWPRVPVVLVNKQPTVPPQLQNRITFAGGTLQEFGEPDILYLNDGRAHFRSVSFTNGAFFDARGETLTSTPLDWGLAAAFHDLNNDGAPDLYVCNDYWTPDRIWINGGRGRFRALDALAVRKIPASSMGVDFADINRDGLIDIFAVDMLSRSSELRHRQTVAKRPVAPRLGEIESRVQTPQNTLLLNRGDGTFAEIACFAGVEASDWSWSPMFLDVDLDGYEDLLITAGHLRDIQDFDANDKIRAQQEPWRRTPLAATNLARAFVEAKREHAQLYPPLDMPIVAYRNRGDARFAEVTTDWGLNVLGVNHGIARADFDRDGDLDLVVNRLGAPAALFRNEGAAPRVAARLRGKAPNTQAVGAKIELRGGAVSNQVQEITCGGRYMSGSDPLCVLASGVATGALTLRITWREGGITEVSGVQPNHLYEIDETQSARLSPPAPRPAPTPPLFEDASALLRHIHHDEPFDDFARQPLLPRKLSQGGGGVSWFDVDADGWEDLIIGSGRGGKLAVFLNQQGKSFAQGRHASFDVPVARDQTTILGWRRGPRQAALLAGSSSYEVDDPRGSDVMVYDYPTGPGESVLSGHTASVGPLALADFDGDGDLDLFVGSEVIPGRYPEPASSLLFQFDRGKLLRDEENSKVLARAGLVHGAVWSDLDGDGFPELVLATEWGPIRVFKNHRGKLQDVTGEWGLAAFTGLWLGVTAGDFDGDGRLDLVAGNWGLNSHARATAQQPLTLFYGDLAGRGAMDVLETEFDPARRQRVPLLLRDQLATAWPFVAERFPTHLAYSRATVDSLVEGRTAHRLQASTLASTVFLNRGGRFEARALPDEAQWAPAFATCVADFDGDGNEDIFLSQNFFAFRIEDARLDAGRGLLLRGDGRGHFAAVPGQESGLKIYGEQRGAAVGDFDADRRVDIAVSQNGAATRLFRNARGRPGLRVRLKGLPDNSTGVGAVLRLEDELHRGPAREIHAGSGYWSQDSAVHILGMGRTPTALWMRWPGGKETRVALPPDAYAVELTADGQLSVVQ